MIVNLASHTIVPRTGSIRSRSRRRKGQRRVLPGGKHLWLALTKVVCGFGLFLFLSSLWLNSSISDVNAEINRVENQHEQLVSANILMRAQKARLFSPETVGELAGDKLAIHLPGSGQYRKF